MLEAGMDVQPCVLAGSTYVVEKASHPQLITTYVKLSSQWIYVFVFLSIIT